MLCEYQTRQQIEAFKSLNPCFNGICSARISVETEMSPKEFVLILVLMEYALRV